MKERSHEAQTETTLDFALTDEQHAFADLARQILGDAATHERLKEIVLGWFNWIIQHLASPVI